VSQDSGAQLTPTAGNPYTSGDVAPAEQLEHLERSARFAGVSAPDIVLPESHHVVLGRMRFHYLDWGAPNRTSIVFLHGGGLNAHTWDLVCLALRDDYHCYALDQRGHGDSEWSPESDYSLDTYLADLERFADHIRATPVVLVGQSLGGVNAIRYASRHPEGLVGLVLVDVSPYARENAGTDRIQEFVRRRSHFASLEEAVDYAKAFNHRRDPRLLRTSLRHQLRRLPDGRWTWKRDRRHLSREWFSALVAQVQALEPEAAAIRCPTLIVRGADSDVFAPADTADFANLLADGRLAVVEHAGHNIQGDNPSGLLDILRPFLAEVAGR
jgi:esterase